MQVVAGACGDDVAHDDVLFEATEIINLGHGGGFGQNPGGVLERRGTQETLGLQRCLRDSQQHGRGFRRLSAHLLDPVVFLVEFNLIDLFAPEEDGVTGFGDANLAQHLPDDDLNVLVVDGHALQAVNFLNFIDEMLLQFLRSADVKNLMRIKRSFGQLLAFANKITLEHDDVFADWNEMFLFRRRLGIADDNAALSTHARTEINNAVNDGLLTKKQLEELINSRSLTTSLCLTGRNFPKSLLKEVDIATDMSKLKHHFDDKFLANKGIDF